MIFLHPNFWYSLYWRGRGEGMAPELGFKVVSQQIHPAHLLGTPPRLLVVQREAALLKGEKADLEGRLSTVQSKM